MKRLTWKEFEALPNKTEVLVIHKQQYYSAKKYVETLSTGLVYNYLCQNHITGAIAPDKLGYKYSYFISEALFKNMEVYLQEEPLYEIF